MKENRKYIINKIKKKKKLTLLKMKRKKKKIKKKGENPGICNIDRTENQE